MPRKPKITLDVTPKRPRLAWQGMERREVAQPAPTRAIEVVRPGGPAKLNARAGDATPWPGNRLIWTSDNLLALQTLLSEKDPSTGLARTRGQVDLVYIDPPFMVNADFRAEGAVEIGDRQSLPIDLLAYKDTWPQGLDDFLTMLRDRLELLKQLLAPTGSIYLHLDWHAVHYAKVLMDEVFGYENFRNEIVWQRTSSHNDPGKFGVIHDTLLYYAASSQAPYWGAPTLPAPPEYFAAHDFEVDENGRRYRSRDLTARSHGGDSGQFEWRGVRPPAGRMWAYSSVTKLEELLAEKRIKFTRNGFPRLKLYLDGDVTQPVQSIWADDAAVNSGAAERLGFPTQKPLSLLERIITASCPSGGLVLDCFAGSGTTAEAAERLGRNWIAIDNSRFAVHLAQKRLVELHGQSRPPVQAKFKYVECDKCKKISRKPKPQKSPGIFNVRPFTVETVGASQAEAIMPIVLDCTVSGRTVTVKLAHCEVDVESFLASQRPVEQTKEEAWQKWLGQAGSWQSFVDCWAVDWDYPSLRAPDGTPIFQSDWQSLRGRKAKGKGNSPVFVARFKYPRPGQYCVAAKMTDVFGNDGMATVQIAVKV